MSARAPAVDIVLQSPLWKQRPQAEAAIRTAIAAAARAVPGKALAASARELSVVLTDDDAIRALNRQWRGIDKPTNVLSFPAATAPARDGSRHSPLGDIVVAYETLARECAEERKDFLHHLSHLTVHGFLHLLGYDHANDSEADDMERLESAILARLDVPDPYLARDTGQD